MNGTTRWCAGWLTWAALLVACSDADGDSAAETDGGEDAATVDAATIDAATGDAATADAAAGDAGGTTDPCPSGAVEGDYVVETDDDALAIERCTEITGDLTLTGDVQAASLSALATVGGSLRIVDATALSTIELPALVTVTRDLEVNDNPELTRFAAPALESCAVLGFSGNAALAEIDVSALVDTGFVRAQRNDALTELDVPKVDELGVFFVSENASIVSVSFESLTTITIDGFILNLNPVLTTVSLPVLTDVFGDILVSMNPMFPTCRAEQIRDQIDDPSVPFVISGNDDSATCP